MRQRYTTLILHLSSYVERKKQALLTRHSWRSFFDVLLLILSEILLATISIPLILSTKETISSRDRRSSEKQYIIRNVLTRGIVALVIALWATKIGLIFLREYTDRRIVNVQQTEVSQTFATPHIAAAPIDAGMPTPIVIGVSGSERHGWITHGTAPAHSTVIVYVTQTDGSDASLKVYVGKADEEGAFAIHEDANRFRLQSGEYAMQAFAYDDVHNIKSAGSNIVIGTASLSRLETFLAHLDTVLNLVVSLALLAGILITLLLL